MVAIDIGRVCKKLTGREAGRYCVVIDTAEEGYVQITGPRDLSNVRRRKCNILHLEPTNDILEIKKSASDEEITKAIEKAIASAKKNVQLVPIVGTTIPHEVLGKFSKASVLLMPAKEGTGVIAGGAARAVIELAGIKDILAKSYGSRNSINSVKATIEGLKALRTKEQIASLRGKLAEEI